MELREIEARGYWRVRSTVATWTPPGSVLPEPEFFTLTGARGTVNGREAIEIQNERNGRKGLAYADSVYFVPASTGALRDAT